LACGLTHFLRKGSLRLAGTAMACLCHLLPASGESVLAAAAQQTRPQVSKHSHAKQHAGASGVDCHMHAALILVSPEPDAYAALKAIYSLLQQLTGMLL
jgi:hypothetical protein